MTPTPVETTLYAYGEPIGRAFVRRVWAAVTRTPNASLRELADSLGAQFGNVSRAIKVLRDAGYITIEGERARRVLIPFYAPIGPTQRLHTLGRADQGKTTRTIVADEPQPSVVSYIGVVKVLGFAPTTVRVEGDTNALSQIGRDQLARAIAITLDVLAADQRAQRWAKAAVQAWDRGETLPVYYSSTEA
jgi:DNA-binding transcriptional MocR family regulator